MSNIDIAVVNSLSSMALEQAKEACKAMFDKARYMKMKPEKIAYLKNQIDQCPTIDKLMRIMWNSILSGDGLSTVGSKYQKRHNPRPQ